MTVVTPLVPLYRSRWLEHSVDINLGILAGSLNNSKFLGAENRDWGLRILPLLNLLHRAKAACGVSAIARSSLVRHVQTLTRVLEIL